MRYKKLFAEIKADEHAARVRDYGEADAATYEQRVREGAATVRHLEPDPAWISLRDRLKVILWGEVEETVIEQPDKDKDRGIEM
ncbi:MAG TPA: hypothetical protein VN648_15530 [Candidatus Methylomirabilis sp.]|nr:hypothetical protein [Candidatus Methylomirabilis sp.]